MTAKSVFLCLFCLACAEPGAEPRAHGRVAFSLLHLSDLHSHVFPLRTRISATDAEHGLGTRGEWAEIAGLARLATLVRRERARAERSLLIDSGDAVEGAEVYDEFGGEVELAGLSRLGVEAQALGNHDLSAGGLAAFQRYQQFASFPVLAANYVADGSGGGFADVLSDSAWLSSSGLRVLVIGVGNVASVSAFSLQESGLGVVPRAAAQAVQSVIDRARPDADFVVLATHLGLADDIALVEHTTGADVVLGGHDHSLLDTPELAQDCGLELARERGCAPRAVPIVHSGAYGKQLGVLELTLSDLPEDVGDPRDRFEIVSQRYRAVPASSDVSEAPDLLELLSGFAPKEPADGGLIAYAPAPLERFGVTGGDSALGNLLADALLDVLGTELSLFNSSTLRADLPAGALDETTLFEALPFDDAPVALWLSSAELEQIVARAVERTARGECRSALQIGGARLELDCASSVFALRSLAGECLAGSCGSHAPARLFSLATTDYVASGGSGVLDPQHVTVAGRAEVSLREAVRRRLAALSPCTEPPGCSQELAAYLDARCQAPLRGSALGCSPAERSARAEQLCATLPCAVARRDGRIELAREP